MWNGSGHPGPKVPRPYWAWEPAKCSLDAVNEAKFCRAMEGRKGLLLVGESGAAKFADCGGMISPAHKHIYAQRMSSKRRGS